ncbi:acyl-ACP--UDP-N-acetylglucosamine O-acyltransferase [Pseudoroseicyclus aestuarii]|uniref:Acyl-[acyl-carrier-protein]--UDP-N-acetylglucosamine O-acyltransferase n=1 Tax=Pseudoroseicyclus aestuarii TaxID=1795041 RepID=A0A318SW95_9RHOB|nr:acyl-ACP--UDP-N-acetylglucosamine O-acyltransferase [Pseudoroseicyclus aestuarii]PYE86211.1 acyl-[acyl-carrier-protein]--UDP-N-acetylglucosamine O-acyltransferase [Pseudoroseicyclus aestuarii]
MIHPTALVEPGAELADGVSIGPFCHVGPKVVLGEGVVLRSHVVVTGDTRIGAGTEVFSFAVLGEVPQDLKYGGEATQLRIGARNRIREHVTVNIGTEGGGGVTRIGDDCLLMAGVHVAHDVQLGDRVIMVNNSGVAGHAQIGDDVILGGISGVHQWVRIGRGAIIGGLSKVTRDVIPFALVNGEDAALEGLNLVGLRRKGTPREDVSALRAALETLRSGDGSFAERAEALRGGGTSMVEEIADFILAGSDRHFLVPR